MKILFIFNHAAPYKVNLLNELAKHHEIDVIFERLFNKDRPKEFYYNLDFKFNLIKIRGLALLNENHISFDIKNYIRKNHKAYDLIIFNGYSTSSEIFALNYAITFKIPYALYINGGIIKDNSFIKTKMKRNFISHASLLFSPCEECDEFLIHYGAKNKIYHYPYSTVYEKELTPPLSRDKKQAIRDKYDIKGARIFVYAGQFIERKNNMTLLNFWKNVSKNYSLLLIGSGNQEKEMRKYIEAHHMNNVTIIPFLKKEEMLSIFQASDFFITLSKEDIYGHMINEALSQSLPVISSQNVVAARHLIKDGENGYLIDLNNLEPLKRIITSHISDEMKENAYKTAKENTIEKMVEAHLKALKEIEDENNLSNNIASK